MRLLLAFALSQPAQDESATWLSNCANPYMRLNAPDSGSLSLQFASHNIQIYTNRIQ